MQQSENRRGEEAATKSLNLDPDQPDLYLTRGVVRFYLGKYNEADADYTETIGRTGRAHHLHILGYANRGSCRAHSGKAADAVKDLTEALAIDPSYALAYGFRGLAHSMLGNHELADKDFAAAETAERVPSPHYMALVLACKGQAMAARGDAKSSDQAFEGALELCASDHMKPVRGYALFHRSVARFDRGQVELAWADITEVVAMNSENVAYAEQYELVRQAREGDETAPPEDGECGGGGEGSDVDSDPEDMPC
jgi:serine/threonine-protein kinase